MTADAASFPQSSIPPIYKASPMTTHVDDDSLESNILEPLQSPPQKYTHNTQDSVEKVGMQIASGLFKAVKRPLKFVKGYSFLSKLPSARLTIDEILEARKPVE